jgi:hypothetical protein
MLKSSLPIYSPTRLTIIYQRIIRFILVGKSLHFIALIGLAIFFTGLDNALSYSSFSLFSLLWWYISIFGLSLPVFAEMDANGRYQDYKKIKDVIYEYGYDDRLVRPFVGSKCQRDAVVMAAKDLNHSNKVNSLFIKLGYRWYHILPDKFVKNPLIILKKEFWFRILFSNTYNLKHFQW